MRIFYTTAMDFLQKTTQGSSINFVSCEDISVRLLLINQG